MYSHFDHLKADGYILGVWAFKGCCECDLIDVVLKIPNSDVWIRNFESSDCCRCRSFLVLQRPVIGFLINRLQHALLHEAYSMIEDGVVSVEDVDKFARLGFGPRMCITGLIEQKDLSGVDVNAAAQRSIVPDLYHNRTPCKMVQDMAARGDHGVKSGKGFYNWKDRDADAYRQAAARKLDRLWQALSGDR